MLNLPFWGKLCTNLVFLRIIVVAVVSSGYYYYRALLGPIVALLCGGNATHFPLGLLLIGAIEHAGGVITTRGNFPCVGEIPHYQGKFY